MIMEQGNRCWEAGRTPSSILLTLNDSGDAAQATRAALDIASGAGADLHVAYAWRPALPPAYTPGPLPVRSDSDCEREAEDLLGAQVGRIEEAGGIVGQAYLVRGSPVDGILDLGEDLGVDLIIAGGQVLGPLSRFFAEGFCEGLVRRASRPVLLVRDGENVWPPSRIVIGGALSDGSRQATKLAASLGKVLGAEGLVMAACAEVPWLPARYEEPVARADERLRRTTMALNDLADELEADLLWRPRAEIVFGDPVTAILEAAEEEPGPALIAVVGRGPGRLERLGLRSGMAEWLLRTSDGPLLVLPRDVA